MKIQYRTKRPVLYWTYYLEQNSRNFEKTKNLNTFKHKMKHYYLNDLPNLNIWNIGGFDYALAIIKIIFHYSLLHSDWRTTVKIGFILLALCYPCQTVFLLTNIAININILCLSITFYCFMIHLFVESFVFMTN